MAQTRVGSVALPQRFTDQPPPTITLRVCNEVDAWRYSIATAA